MTDELEKLSQRVAEINAEIVRLMPQLVKSTTAAYQSRYDTDLWAHRLAPLFEEHHDIKFSITSLFQVQRNGKD